MGKLGYRPGLDGLRGIAILFVMVFHFAPVSSGGYLGVTVFFVLSGFLITTLLLEERTATGRVSLQGFYIRRIRRLAPALLAAVAGFTAISAWKYQNDPHELARSLRGSAFALTSTTNIADSWHIFGGGPAPISHTWSLGLEDQFYLVWPPLMLLILARYRQRVAVAVLALVSAAVVVNASTLEASGAYHYRILFAPDTASSPILIGCLAALALHTDAARQFQRSTLARGFDVAGMAAILWFMVAGFPAAIPAALGQMGPLVFAVVVALLLIRTVSNGPTWLGWTAAKPLVTLGLISYSLYLWHVIIFWADPFPALPLLNVLLAVIAAIVSYHLIEQPFRRRRSKNAPAVAPAAQPA